jgi:membrane protein
MTTPATPDEAPPSADRWRVLAERLVQRLGGLPAVRILIATFTVYDRAGGGLTAAGLAYAALFALLPGMLLVVSILAIVISDDATRERIVSLIADAVPPLEDIVRTAFEQVSAGAVPTGIIAFIGLLWGASRFYAALDYSFSKIFSGSRQRNEIERTLRGVLLVAAVVLVPLLLLFAGTLVGWLLTLVPDQSEVPPILTGDLALALHLGSYVLFVLVTLAVYRFVPPDAPPRRALVVPAVVIGLALGAFTQVFTILAPLMTKVAAIYGTFVAAFAILIWMSIGFNLLLVGASWTRVRALAQAQPDAPEADPNEPAPSAQTVG